MVGHAVTQIAITMFHKRYKYDGEGQLRDGHPYGCQGLQGLIQPAAKITACQTDACADNNDTRRRGDSCQQGCPGTENELAENILPNIICSKQVLRGRPLKGRCEGFHPIWHKLFCKNSHKDKENQNRRPDPDTKVHFFQVLFFKLHE